MMTFSPGSLYTHEEIYRPLGVGNAGGIRVSKDSNGRIQRAVLLTSAPTARVLGENPYHDRIEGDVLIYTGAGQEGDQALGGSNKRLLDQLADPFPIYCFQLIGSRRRKDIGPKRWMLLGLLSHLRQYKENQVDTRGALREVCIFEFRILAGFGSVSPSVDRELMADLVSEQERERPLGDDDRLLARPSSIVERTENTLDTVKIETIRSQMLGLAPDRFEHLIKAVLVCTGFLDVRVTRYSQDGGIDVNASVGTSMWPLRDLLLQVQAKRWLHTVGRREVAELRGSLQPHARGAVVTTSQFSRAALNEASEAGKLPIVLVDGLEFARLVSSLGVPVREVS